MDKLRIPGLTGVDLSTSDADTPPNKLLHSENFILSSKYGNLRRRGGSIEYAITGDIYGLGGYAQSNVSFLSPISLTPVRYRVASSTPYFEKLDWDQEGDIRNFLIYSEQLDNAAWNKINTTVTANSAVAPDGTTTADTLTCSAGSSVKYVYPTASPAGLAAGNIERHSVSIKKGNHPYVSVSNAYADTLVYDFDTNSILIGTAAGGFTDYSVEGEGNGWYRFTIEFMKTDSSTRQLYVGMRGVFNTETGVGSFASAAGTETIHVWGMQANNGTDLETYVKTTSASVETPAWSSVTIHSDVSSLLQTSGIVRMPQIEDTLAVFAGTPAMITDIATGELQRLGSDAPSTAPTIAASAGAGALTGDYYCAYTYYDPTSGWESSLSPFSTLLTVTAKNIEWSALPTTATKKGVTQLRLYRTESSGEQVFYRVTTHNLGSATYTDNVTLLGSISTEIGENDPPPTGAYLGEEYANRLWTTDGGTSLRWSKAFDGNQLNLQYWPDTNEISFNHKITGLRKSERLGGLLVFKSPGYGVDLIRGTSEDTFELVPLYSELGTSYDSSITVHGDDVVFWGDGRPVLIRNGNVVPYYSKPLDDRLRQLALSDYNVGSYVWSFYHKHYQQVFWGVSALSNTGGSWEELGSGLFASWEVKSTGAPTTWTD